MPDRKWPDLFVEELEGMEENRRCAVLHEFVASNRPEDLYLDFVTKKDSTKADLSDDDRRNFAKAASGYAHSDGGILIWGIEARRQKGGDPESPDVASARKPIANLRAFHSNLNAYIPQATKPTVDGIRNLIVWEDERKETGYVVTHVPVGLTPPYRATICNNHFYKRSGSSFYPMEPYDIRDVIFRFDYPKIKLSFVREDMNLASDVHVYSLGVTIRNEGPHMLQQWKLVVDIPEVLLGPNLDLSGQTGFRVKHIRIGSRDYRRFVLASHPLTGDVRIAFIPVFPEEEIQLAGATLPRKLRYAITTSIYHDQLPQRISWRFYADRGPMQSGEILIKQRYDPGEQEFSFF